ncbi:MAG: hypothetical protein A2498_01075 [Lentisphaerae bacterium RIFOXYC12_FULL_60_16]|nr:MAG: hypothetical protein A2498_01075 [Lentisphaerae bacterium RIFOXYC12_FULL_60_16]OGV83800.1 MAG: hypothetical protein A2340_06795 [Lentisphaerae bacterium RIFOXYB12_FULL_60_10]
MVAIYAVIAAAVYCIVGLSFALCYATGRFFDFGHAAVLAVCPYCVLFLTRTLDFPLAVALPVALALGALLGAAKELAVYRPLRVRHASPLVLLIASIGVYLVLQNSISLAFGDDTKTLAFGPVREGFAILGARITTIQVAVLIAAAIVVSGGAFLLRRTRTGTHIRAVGESPPLALSVGIDAPHVGMLSACIGSALAGLAGSLIALDVGMTPTMGMRALLMGVVAMIIGGSQSPLGISLGALLLALSGALATQLLGSQWQDPTAFFALLVFLLMRPQGVMGKLTLISNG